jgi:hypothetical protein
VPSETACLRSSPESARRAEVCISRERKERGGGGGGSQEAVGVGRHGKESWGREGADVFMMSSCFCENAFRDYVFKASDLRHLYTSVVSLRATENTP